MRLSPWRRVPLSGSRLRFTDGLGTGGGRRSPLVTLCAVERNSHNVCNITMPYWYISHTQTPVVLGTQYHLLCTVTFSMAVRSTVSCTTDRQMYSPPRDVSRGSNVRVRVVMLPDVS